MLIGVYANLMRSQLTIWRSSTHLWEHASTLEPRSSELLGNLAEAYSNDARPKKAIQTFERALRMEGGEEKASAQLHHMFAECLKKVSKHQERAKNHYEHALSRDPLLSESAASLAWWGEENKQLDGGEYVVQKYKQAEEIAMYGLTIEGRKKRVKSTSKTNPYNVLRSGPFWLSYGLAIDRLLKRQKNGGIAYNMNSDQGPTKLDSREKYLRAVALDPTMAEGHYRLSKLEEKAKDAHSRLDLALKHSGRKMVDALFAKANLHHKNGQDIQAIPLYLDAIKFQPRATDLRINCALAYRDAGEYSKSIQMARSVLEIDSFHKKASMLVDELISPSDDL